ncbi:hypothetical protein QP794_24525 [Paenibacillus sp. UMB7766-LJ446]|uniref:hypothetical protein n=1 Tax=Paenibacillus sp. UMB7766-LJ446 TaxID=3046313 RepID=UPI00254E6225|nr:hypothetical protein [Paenibacillus sp. UMB7766-LJ446]MDK8193258.1 hypothetical protein [Paenibacillus sp. UMB7766-LJ446]
MNRIIICSSERDECDFLKEELEDFGKVVKVVESLDFFISQWESSTSINTIVFSEYVVKNTSSFEKLIKQVKATSPEVQMLFLHFREIDGFMQSLSDLGIICISYIDLTPGMILTKLQTESRKQITQDIPVSRKEETSDNIDESSGDTFLYTRNEPEPKNLVHMPEQTVSRVEEAPEILDDNQENTNSSEKILKSMILKGKELRKVLEIKKSHSDIRIEDLNFDPLLQKRKKVRDRFIGTIIIAITGVEKGVGCTHTSLLIANYLAKQKFSVALVEANESNEYKEIESSYEGVDSDLLISSSFYINGVHFYKNQNNIDVIPLLSGEYAYIVLDLGNYVETESYNEFLRANIQIVVGSSRDWKQHKIDEFIDSQIHLDQSNWRICLPLSEKQDVKDLKKKLSRRQLYTVPYFPDPFDSSEAIEDFMEKMLKINQQHRLSLLRKKMLNVFQ